MRTVKSTKATSSYDSADKPSHYVNIYQNGVQIGYMVIDKQPALVAKCQSDDEFANRLLKHASVSAAYRELGSSTKELALDDI